MALFNHAAMWEDEPELMPKGYYCNGHVLVDGEKMSKSKGNFLMMNETVENFTVDGTRFACADAGDSLDDANFSRETADNAILSLTNEESWITETMASSDLRTGVELNFMDNVLQNETNRLITATGTAFAGMQFREGLQYGWYEMLMARGEYRSWCQDSGTAMHKDVIQKWAEALMILICPICPHW
jgi:leucyl-tRNA synthetase